MDWQGAIEDNRAGLAKVVVALYGMIAWVSIAGIENLTDPAKWEPPVGIQRGITRAMRIQILRQLRAAEAGARRLIVALARGIKLPPPPSKSPLPDFKSFAAGKGIVPLPLYDPVRDYGMTPRRKITRCAPRILQPLNPDFVFTPTPEPQLPCLEDRLDPLPLFRRLAGLHIALGDLHRQARRMARAEARRKAGPSRKQPPIRIGRAPGYSRRRTEGVYWLLGECCWIGREAQFPP